MGIQEKYAKATVSSNLKDDAGHHDHERLAAMALCGVPLGPLLIRARLATTESNPGALYQLGRAWLDVCAKTAFMEGWPKNVLAGRVATVSLEYWISDICPECYGRKSDGIKNTPCLSGHDCKACKGTGKRDLPADRIHGAYFKKMVAALEIETIRAVNGASKQAKDEPLEETIKRARSKNISLALRKKSC